MSEFDPRQSERPRNLIRPLDVNDEPAPITAAGRVGDRLLDGSRWALARTLKYGGFILVGVVILGAYEAYQGGGLDHYDPNNPSGIRGSSQAPQVPGLTSPSPSVSPTREKSSPSPSDTKSASPSATETSAMSTVSPSTEVATRSATPTVHVTSHVPSPRSSTVESQPSTPVCTPSGLPLTICAADPSELLGFHDPLRGIVVWNKDNGMRNGMGATPECRTSDGQYVLVDSDAMPEGQQAMYVPADILQGNVGGLAVCN